MDIPSEHLNFHEHWVRFVLTGEGEVAQVILGLCNLPMTETKTDTIYRYGQSKIAQESARGENRVITVALSIVYATVPKHSFS